MTDIELQSTIDTESDRVKVLVDSLPTHFPKAVESPNYEFFGAVGEASDRVVEDVEAVHIATRIQEAETIDDLHELGKIVGVTPKNQEGVERYRIRLLGSFQNVTSEGTITNLLTNTAYVLDISIENVEYIETEGHIIEIKVPSSSIDDSVLTTDEIFEILEQNVAAGRTLRGVLKGTFEHVSVQDYNDGNHVSTDGYAGLDAGGNVTETGGTYSTATR